MAERRVEDAALAGSEDEGHRLGALVHFRGGFGEHVDIRITREAGVEFIGGGEVRDALGDGVSGLEDADQELAVGIVGALLRIPNAAGYLDISVPFLQRPATEVGDDQSAAVLNILFEIPLLRRGPQVHPWRQYSAARR